MGLKHSSEEKTAAPAADVKIDKSKEILNAFPPRESFEAGRDLTGSKERSQIIDPLPPEDVCYLIPLAEEADGYLRSPGGYYKPGLDRFGKPAQTIKPLRGHVILMCPRWFREAQYAAEQAELDRQNEALGQKAKSPRGEGVGREDDPQGGYGTPDVQINRGTLTENKKPA